jgi:hypothetical protein
VCVCVYVCAKRFFIIMIQLLHHIKKINIYIYIYIYNRLTICILANYFFLRPNTNKYSDFRCPNLNSCNHDRDRDRDLRTLFCSPPLCVLYRSTFYHLSARASRAEREEDQVCPASARHTYIHADHTDHTDIHACIGSDPI